MRKTETSYNTSYQFNVDATNVATNVVSVAEADLANVIADMGDQVTVVVVPAKSTNITDANIYYINQDANGVATAMLTGMGTKALAADTDYEVWVGGSNGTIKKGFFTTKPDEDPVVYGEVDGLTGISSNDAATVAQQAAGLIELSEALKKNADVDGLVGISSNDAATVAQYAAGLITKFPVEQ